MVVTSLIEEARQVSRRARLRGEKIAFIPTMGALHEGHLSLVRRGRNAGDFVIVSVFVNPKQFGPHEDLSRYPRDLARDQRLLEELATDLFFCPADADLYPDGYETFIAVQQTSMKLCGAFRPNHFQGVSTVLTKLFHILQPHIAIFGEKDYQQLTLVRKMVRDLNFDIEILGSPTVREPDGLALSSRNAYLNAEERKAALVLKQSIDMAQEMTARGKTDCRELRELITERISLEPLARLEYVSICDPETLEDVSRVEGKTLLALAVWIGQTRLIDNRILSSFRTDNTLHERANHEITHA